MVRSGVVSLGLVLVTACGGGGYKYTSADDWVAQTSAPGQLLVLASKAGEWSAPKVYPYGGASLQVESKFIEHKGTTCMFEIRVSNLSSEPVRASAAMVKEDSARNADGQVELREHRFADIELSGNSNAVWEMETRECPLHFGSTSDMGDCASCRPVFGFL
jgi:hypothetical protein